QEATGVQTETVSNTSGYYTFPALNVGTYTLTVNSRGFRTARRSGLRVVSGIALEANFDLIVGSTTQVVNVTGGTLPIDTMSSTQGTRRTHTDPHGRWKTQKICHSKPRALCAIFRRS